VERTQEANIRTYLERQGIGQAEGSSTDAQLAYLTKVATDERVRRIAEIGFNTGASSEAFLKANARANVTAFDLGVHDYVRISKAYIDQHFPGRHELILGDSRETVPRYADQNGEVMLDLVFVDGGHDFGTASADLRNLRRLAHDRTLVVMDDLMPWEAFGAGPNRAWAEAVREGLVVEIERVQDGVVVDRIEPTAERAWALGRYVF
jgi:predicted O-methyltransferase YrrM